MCGRFTRNYTWQQIHALYRLTAPAAIPNLRPIYNVCPTDPADTVVANAGKHEFVEMRWGCAWTLAIYVTQIGSLAMIVIGLCYLVLARNGVITSVTDRERMAPALCASGIIAEVVAGFAGYYAVLAVWPNFYYGAVRHGIWAWLGLQAVCIAIYLAGVMYAYGGIKRALPVLTGAPPTRCGRSDSSQNLLPSPAASFCNRAMFACVQVFGRRMKVYPRAEVAGG